ncbi:alpha/beta fold hydrolase [Nocardia mikamii]|uniref:alpha/beta fold hydrolase n=1 Tax=Nocardia mikamii TaxID=508464 RepID=UPI0007A3FD9E|nr:alpha/beta hydrolase [Nocardia mikamii]
MNVLIATTRVSTYVACGYPESHRMWRKVAGELAERFTVVVTDLRGYGDSEAPEPDPEHRTYAKRASARDQVAVMEALGHERFAVAGHDRGARVVHRMALDSPERLSRAAVLDIVPTPHVFETMDGHRARSYWHWFFLIQEAGLPERLIGADPEYFLRRIFGNFAEGGDVVDDEAFAAYLQAWRDPAKLAASCEDYRAGASADLADHAADTARIRCPLLVLWGADGALARLYDDPLAVWSQWADDVRGHAVPGGHFLPEESPRETVDALLSFFTAPT